MCDMLQGVGFNWRAFWLQNKLNINDWSSVQSLFDKLNKQMEKAQKATESLGAPRVYIKMLVELEVCFVATF